MKNLLNLLKEVAIDICVVAKADGGSDSFNGDGLDMSGYEGVTFLGIIGTVTGAGVVTLTAQASSDDGSSDSYGDLAGTSTAKASTSDKLLALNIHQPTKRYVRPVIARTVANSVLGGVIAIRYGARKAPVTQGADITTSVSVITPAEGTP